MALTVQEQALVDQLRSRITDTRYIIEAFDLFCEDTAATAATVEFDGVNLILDMTGGAGTDRTYPIATYKTLGEMVQKIIDDAPGWKVTPHNLMEWTHLMSDVRVFPPTDAKAEAKMLYTRRFTDEELLQLVKDGIVRHNNGLTVTTIPSNEVAFALTLSHAEYLYDVATDVVKRRNLDQSVEDLINLARQLEKKYDDDLKRNNLDSNPTDADPLADTENQSGDVSIGKLYRRNLRSGAKSAFANYPPKKPSNFTATFVDRGGGDRFIEMKWDRIREDDYALHLIYRSGATGTTLLLTPFYGFKVDPITAEQVFSTSDMRQVLFRDKSIQPNTTYFYKLFVIDTNYEFSESDEKTLTTPAW